MKQIRYITDLTPSEVLSFSGVQVPNTFQNSPEAFEKILNAMSLAGFNLNTNANGYSDGIERQRAWYYLYKIGSEGYQVDPPTAEYVRAYERRLGLINDETETELRIVNNSNCYEFELYIKGELIVTKITPAIWVRENFRNVLLNIPDYIQMLKEYKQKYG